MEPATSNTRIRTLNAAPARADGEYVLYWMVAARRPHYNFGLQRAVELAVEHGVGVVVLEPLRLEYPWASDRLHTFVLQGMRDNEAALKKTSLCYYPYVEPGPGAGKGLLEALAARACAVVTDDFPCFFLPRMLAKAAEVLAVQVEAIDSNGLYPMYATDRVFTTAASFRRHLQKELPEHLRDMPRKDPTKGVELPGVHLPADVTRRWPAQISDAAQVAQLPIDHAVRVAPMKGGSKAARKALGYFVDEKLQLFGEGRNHPDTDAQSHLSPYLHFGHISAHEVFLRLIKLEGWTPERLAPKATGSRSGWWGCSGPVESFLDELITWREIGLNMCALRSDFDSFESLPGWAQDTLEIHSTDPRPYLYSMEELEAARTHDLIWNAAQRQLVRDGYIHNYLRMLWGKKILEWTASPREALDVMLELNNKYALDGRDPNSYSGIFWVLGRYDRAWGPERPIFGKIRFMSSDSTARKLKLKSYLARYAENPQLELA